MKLPKIENDLDFTRIMETCDALLRAKGADYTQGGGPLDNFYANAKRLGLSPYQIWGVYASKHWSAIETFIQKGQVESEPIESRIVDVINYLLLLGKMAKHEAYLKVKAS